MSYFVNDILQEPSFYFKARFFYNTVKYKINNLKIF